MRRAHPNSRRSYRSRPPIPAGERIAIQSSAPRVSPGLPKRATAAARISKQPIPDRARTPDQDAGAGAARRAPWPLPHGSNVFPRRQSAQIKAGLRDKLRRILALARGADYFVLAEGNESQTNDQGGRQSN